MSIPAGWYPDPHPDAREGGLRWWDGTAWSDQTDAGGPVPSQTAQTAQASHTEPTAQAAETAQTAAFPSTQPTVELQKADARSYPGQPQQTPPYQAGYATQPAQGYYPATQGYPAQGYVQQAPAVPKMTHCPDGAQLASPWVRLGAYLLDSLFAFLVATVIVLVVGGVVGGGALALFAVGSSTDGSFEGAAASAGFGLFILLYMVAIALSLLYSVWAFGLRVRTHGASPGKQVLGLRIRTFHADGQLTNGQVWGRLGLPYLASMVTFGISPIIDYLWLLWDPHTQCLHDKAVGTVVVDTRVPLAPPEHPGVQLARAFPAARGWMADGPVPPGTTTPSYKR